MTIAVTGANGFIGTNLRARLALNNISHFAIPHDMPLPEIVSTLRAKKPSAMVHLASVFIAEHKPEDIDVLIDSNVGFGTRILEACRQAEVRRVVITGSSWQHTASPCVAVNLYGALKNGLESVARYYSDAEGFSVAFLKLYDSYGKDDQRPKLIPHLLKLYREGAQGNPMRLSPGDQIVDFTHVENSVDALLSAIQWTEQNPGRFQDFIVSGGEPVKLRELIGLIEEVTQFKFPVLWGERPYRNREVMTPWKDAPSLPGYSPKISLREGFADIFGVKS